MYNLRQIIKSTNRSPERLSISDLRHLQPLSRAQRLCFRSHDEGVVSVRLGAKAFCVVSLLSLTPLLDPKRTLPFVDEILALSRTSFLCRPHEFVLMGRVVSNLASTVVDMNSTTSGP